MTVLRPFLTAALMAVAAAGLSGCAGAVLGAGASAGVAAAEERGFEGSLEDAKIRAEINHYWFQHDVEMYRKVTLTISEGRVLLTGVVPSESASSDAVRLTWQAAGVREVYNELEVMPDGAGLINQGRDSVIANTLRIRMLGDKEIKNINFSVDVVNGVVYLMGIAQSEGELDRVIAHARDVENVRRVISHVRLRNDPRRNGG